MSFIFIKYSYTPCIRLPFFHFGHRNKQAYVLLTLVEWALKQLEVNGAVRLITGPVIDSSSLTAATGLS